jgi:hypothetical protein
VKWISLPVFYDSSPTISIAEAIPGIYISKSSHVNKLGIFSTTLSCNAKQPQPLSKTVHKHELQQLPAVPAHFTGAYLDVSKFPIVYQTFYVPNDL